MITIDGQKVKIATIDTMLSFYLAFLYSSRNYYDSERIVCMAQFLFQVQQQNRLQQKGLLRRFSINCYGHQQTLEEIRAEKAEKFKEFKQSKKKNEKEYEEWFLRYRPEDTLSLRKLTKGKDKGKEKEKEKEKGKSRTKSKNNKKMTAKIIKTTKKNTSIKKRGRGGLFY
jgi:hypothetical protein